MDTDIILALLQLQELDNRIEKTGKEPTKSQEAKREKLSKKIPVNIIDEYNRMRDNQRTALAHIDDGYCSGCNMSVPPYVAEGVIYNDELGRCEHCGRFLVDKRKDRAVVPA